MIIQFFLNRWNTEISNSISDIDDKSKNNNEIYLLLNIEKNDINKEVYFLNKEYIIDSKFKIYINKIKKNSNKFFIPENEGEYDINLSFDQYLFDCSHMFEDCKK